MAKMAPSTLPVWVKDPASPWGVKIEVRPDGYGFRIRSKHPTKWWRAESP